MSINKQILRLRYLEYLNQFSFLVDAQKLRAEMDSLQKEIYGDETAIREGYQRRAESAAQDQRLRSLLHITT